MFFYFIGRMDRDKQQQELDAMIVKLCREKEKAVKGSKEAMALHAKIQELCVLKLARFGS
jgi:hypothetical protein